MGLGCCSRTMVLLLPNVYAFSKLFRGKRSVLFILLNEYQNYLCFSQEFWVLYVFFFFTEFFGLVFT